MQTTRIKSVKLIGKQKSLDFEIKSKDHNFVADGIVVSNSHSASYGLLSIITAYFKFTYPKEFYLSLLTMAKYEQKIQEVIGEISREMLNFGIRLLPPDVFKSKEDFSIEEQGIRYGLSSIKGISSKTISKVVEFAKNYGTNKYGVFFAAKESHLGIGALCALIHVGALGENRRCRLVLEAQTWNKLTDREKRNLAALGDEYGYDLLKSIKDVADNLRIGDDSKPIIPAKRFEKIKKDYAPYKAIYEKNVVHEQFANWFFEKKLLGYSHSKSLKDCCEDAEEYTTLQEMKDLPDDANVKLICQNHAHFWKKSMAGNNYLRIECSDDTGGGTVMFFEKKNRKTGLPDKKFLAFKEESGKKIKEDSILQVVGKKRGDAVFADEIYVVDEKIYLKYSELDKDSKTEQV